MDWDNLKHFLALAESGSLSRASRKLGVDHSTVSRRVEALEQELNIRLVERLARSYRITAEGEKVRDRLAEVAVVIAGIARLAQSASGSAQRVVRVNGPPTLVNEFLAARLLPVQKVHPGLRIEIVGESRSVSLSRGEADVVLRMARPHEKGLVARRVASIEYRLYGSREYLAKSHGSPQDFLGFDAAHDKLPQQRWLQSIAAGRAMAVQASDHGVLLTAVRAGLGVAILPCIMASRHPDLCSIPVPIPPMTLELWLAFHRDVGRSPAVRTVIDAITSIMAAAQDAFAPPVAAQRRRAAA